MVKRSFSSGLTKFPTLSLISRNTLTGNLAFLLSSAGPYPPLPYPSSSVVPPEYLGGRGERGHFRGTGPQSGKLGRVLPSGGSGQCQRAAGSPPPAPSRARSAVLPRSTSPGDKTTPGDCPSFLRRARRQLAVPTLHPSPGAAPPGGAARSDGAWTSAAAGARSAQPGARRRPCAREGRCLFLLSPRFWEFLR